MLLRFGVDRLAACIQGNVCFAICAVHRSPLNQFRSFPRAEQIWDRTVASEEPRDSATSVVDKPSTSRNTIAARSFSGNLSRACSRFAPYVGTVGVNDRRIPAVSDVITKRDDGPPLPPHIFGCVYGDPVEPSPKLARFIDARER